MCPPSQLGPAVVFSGSGGSSRGELGLPSWNSSQSDEVRVPQRGAQQDGLGGSREVTVTSHFTQILSDFWQASYHWETHQHNLNWRHFKPMQVLVEDLTIRRCNCHQNLEWNVSWLPSLYFNLHHSQWVTKIPAYILTNIGEPWYFSNSIQLLLVDQYDAKNFYKFGQSWRCKFESSIWYFQSKIFPI